VYIPQLYVVVKIYMLVIFAIRPGNAAGQRRLQRRHMYSILIDVPRPADVQHEQPHDVNRVREQPAATRPGQLYLLMGFSASLTYVFFTIPLFDSKIKSYIKLIK
jgi:hypothetical protein